MAVQVGMGFWVLNAVGDASPVAYVSNVHLRGGGTGGDLILSSNGIQVYGGRIDGDDFGSLPIDSQTADITVVNMPAGCKITVWGKGGYWG
jgi:hypothetical protein